MKERLSHDQNTPIVIQIDANGAFVKLEPIMINDDPRGRQKYQFASALGKTRTKVPRETPTRSSYRAGAIFKSR